MILVAGVRSTAGVLSALILSSVLLTNHNSETIGVPSGGQLFLHVEEVEDEGMKEEVCYH